MHGGPYPQFVAPALLAASAMNGAVFDSTFNVFFKLKYAKLYDAVLATPMGPRDIAVGEISWSLIRGGLYSAAFLVVAVLAGAVGSWWALLALPAAVFIGFAFAALGMFATTFMRSWVHFDYITLAIQPMFLFSATFFPLSTYPEALQWLVRATPLYHGVALERALMLGDVGWGVLAHVAYLVVLGGGRRRGHRPPPREAAAVVSRAGPARAVGGVRRARRAHGIPALGAALGGVRRRAGLPLPRPRRA